MSQDDIGFFERFVSSLEDMGKRVEEFFGSFFEGVLTFIEKIQQWIKVTITRIKEYLTRFFRAFGRLLEYSFKLSLFYIPGVILLIVGSPSTILIGVIYMFLITAIGLTYGKRKENETTKRQ